MFYFLTATTSTTADHTPIIEPAAKQLNALQRWWENINWDEVIGLMIQKSMAIAFLIVLFLILRKLAIFTVEQAFKNNQSSKLSAVRLKTLKALVTNMTHYTLGFFFIYALLSILGVPVSSLLAGAGIVGLAIGLGAQGFTNDIITGFFIIFEQQIDVGDYIELKNLAIEGTVISVGLRTLQLRSADGIIHFIPNRNITTVSNSSRGDRRVVVDVRVVPTEGLEQIKATIQQANDKIETNYASVLKTPPAIFGLVDLGNSNYAIRTNFTVENGMQLKIQQELLSLSIQELTDAGYTIPSSPITLK
ncbi:mechanosensitive ion channel family protein [Enterococcus lemanii]|uniref:Mechanosensitive ion channel family protein n=1 Tax=Enterococcus lemanii TaxID=1159752 RepID=A0ABV9MXH5_9ENTE|nr:mechanosensitive ion channel domain-containing protein [Enterococcus lemanii]MBM7709209.1 small conductance mechanosensitive channel [Enterococcus lemanii]